MKNILITGGCGYIGSHAVVEFIEQGYTPVILDNLSNCSSQVPTRIERITGVLPEMVKADVRDDQALDALFTKIKFSAVIHFAGLKAVGESVEKPLLYYRNNVQGTLALLKAMAKHQVKNLVFSSSATVYGDPATVPINEGFPRSATNPYGHSKLMIENILSDICAADESWQVSILRYFNPVAAHSSGVIGEDPKGIPNNLMPYIAQVAAGKLNQLSVFGDDYDTPDGTGVRDYIHVVDLVKAHLKALQKLGIGHRCKAYNIGTGSGYSVFQMIESFENACGRKINYQIKPRRLGDIGTCYADASLAKRMLGWQAEYGIDRMMQDHWRWQSQNPMGYEG